MHDTVFWDGNPRYLAEIYRRLNKKKTLEKAETCAVCSKHFPSVLRLLRPTKHITRAINYTLREH